MIDLDKHYNKLSAQELVAVLESNDAYLSEVIEFCKKRLNEMDLPKEELKHYSREILKKRFYNYFTEGKYLSSEIINIDSFFLSKKEAISCFKISKSEYIIYLDAATRNLPSG